MTRTEWLFWICISGGVFNLAMAVWANSAPQTRENVSTFVMSAALLGVGAVANYIRHKHETSKKDD